MKKISLFLPIFFLLFSLKIGYAQEQTTLYLQSLENSYNERGDLVSHKIAINTGNTIILRNTNYQTKETSISYLYPDHLSSTTLIDTYNDKGNQRTTLSYYPYGNTRETKDTKEDRLYTSQRKDFLSSLYFYNARYYNSTSSHFISADKAQGPNRYSYVGNNPVMRNDPSGNISEDELRNIIYEYNNHGMKKNIQLILVTNNSDDPKIREIYNFMTTKGFWGMAHEDLPITREFACYPNCQFYKKEVLPLMNYDYAEQLVFHEGEHNFQAYNDPQLAEHIWGSPSKQEAINKSYQILLEGEAELQVKTTDAYSKYKKTSWSMQEWLYSMKEDQNFRSIVEKSGLYTMEENQKVPIKDSDKYGGGIRYINNPASDLFYATGGNYNAFLRVRKFIDYYLGKTGGFDELLASGNIPKLKNKN